MIELPRIGFGAYRISHRSNDHREALIHAIENGCGLIDTSANYTDGESEILIGEVLQECTQKPIIVTKAGYIQGTNQEEVKKLNLKEGLTVIDENLAHSIHPTFLANQLQNSLIRLNLEKIDIFLLHNPEYFFQEEGAYQDEYYRRIEKALIFLEQERKKGRIGEYGISSNNFILSPNEAKATVLSRVLEIVRKNDLKGFTTVQFPMNLLEMDALKRFEERGSLLEQIKLNNLKAMINRPLNAFSSQRMVRLATYSSSYQFPSKEEYESHFQKCLELIQVEWDSQDNEGEKLQDIPVLKQFTEIWNKLPTPEAVEQVFYGHFFPLLAGIWGGVGLGPKEAEPFYDLFEMALLLSRKQMDLKAKEFQKQAQSSGLLPVEDDKELAIQAVEKYLSLGIDCVLVGMREKVYVNQLKHLF